MREIGKVVRMRRCFRETVVGDSTLCGWEEVLSTGRNWVIFRILQPLPSYFNSHDQKDAEGEDESSMQPFEVL